MHPRSLLNHLPLPIPALPRLTGTATVKAVTSRPCPILLPVSNELIDYGSLGATFLLLCILPQIVLLTTNLANPNVATYIDRLTPDIY